LTLRLVSSHDRRMLRLADIEAAQARLRDAVLVSPCTHSRVLS